MYYIGVLKDNGIYEHFTFVQLLDRTAESFSARFVYKISIWSRNDFILENPPVVRNSFVPAIFYVLDPARIEMTRSVRSILRPGRHYFINRKK